MTLPLKDQLLRLVSLQEVDLKITRITEKRDAVPGRLQEIKNQLLASQKLVDTKQEEVVEIEKSHRQTVAAIELNEDRSKRTLERIDAVKNTKEFQASSKEIDQLTRLAAQLQEQKNNSQTGLDAAKKVLEDLISERDKYQAEHDELAGKVNSEIEAINKDISELTSEREQYTKDVHRPLLSRYDRVRARQSGVGLVPAVGGRCNGCNIMLPPQMYNELYVGKELHSCPSCFRILFLPTEGFSTLPETGTVVTV